MLATGSRLLAVDFHAPRFTLYASRSLRPFTPPPEAFIVPALLWKEGACPTS